MQVSSPASSAQNSSTKDSTVVVFRQRQRRRQSAPQTCVAMAQRPSKLAALLGERPHQLAKALLCGVVRDDRERLGELGITPSCAPL